MTELEFLKEMADEIALGLHDGHWTLMKFTTNWRFGFGTPSEREDIEMMSEGSTAELAMRRGITLKIKHICSQATSYENKLYEETERRLKEIEARDLRAGAESSPKKKTKSKDIQF